MYPIPPLPRSTDELVELDAWIADTADQDHSGLLSLMAIARSADYEVIRAGALLSIRRVLVRFETYARLTNPEGRPFVDGQWERWPGTLAELFETANAVEV